MDVIRLEQDLYSGVYTLFYFDKEVGYISKIKYMATGERGYRGISVHGGIVYARSLKMAKTRLMEAYH
jgi:hypothetical protein